MFIEELKKELSPHLSFEPELIEIPKAEFGDFAYPCFKAAKDLKKNPFEVAKEIATAIHPNDTFERIVAQGPYVNFFLSRTVLAKEALHKEYTHKKNNKNIVIDFSSPNIAKPFGIAHIRSTAIGHSLRRILQSRGYNVIAVNHLGDWGTQFGKLIVAYQKWGDEKKLENNALDHLLELYIRFTQEETTNAELAEQGRAWFKKIEEGNPQALKMWELFKELSLTEFKRYYKRLHIEFDTYHGESFYFDKLDDALETIKKKVNVELSEGAQIINLEQFKLPPVLLLKSDGASTYHSRDLAALFYRLAEYKPEKIIYVVDKRQQLHFEQVFKAMQLMGYDPALFSHVWFGSMSFEGNVMSTREGNFILLEQVLDLAIEKVKKVIDEKNPGLTSRDTVAEQVGTGAILFYDLMNDRIKDVDFSWDRALSYEGSSAPYVQYTHARICSILRRAAPQPKPLLHLLQTEEERKLLRHLLFFDAAIDDAAKQEKPHHVARYLLDLCQLYNSFYAVCSVLQEDADVKNARLHLCCKVRDVLQYGLFLLGIEAPEEM